MQDAVRETVRRIIAEALGIEGRSQRLPAEARLFGAIPEFDSMAVVAVITALERRFGFSVDDDEITAETFESLGSLTSFVEYKLRNERARRASSG